jgi:hypothetical protein
LESLSKLSAGRGDGRINTGFPVGTELNKRMPLTKPTKLTKKKRNDKIQQRGTWFISKPLFRAHCFFVKQFNSIVNLDDLEGSILRKID